MKKNLMLMLVLSVWTMLYSCSESDKESSEVSLTVSPSKVEFGAQGGSRELAVVTTAEAWTASSDAEWCKIEQAGEKLKLTVEGHNEVELRTTKVTVKAERAVDQIVEVRQSAAVAANLELLCEGKYSGELEFAAKQKETKTVTIETNQADVKIDTAETASWCHITLAEDNTSLSVTLDLNSEPARETVFTVIAGTESNKAKESVKVKQADGSVKIELSTQEIQLNSLGYRDIITVTAELDGGELKAVSDADWCKVEVANDRIIISAPVNFGRAERNAVVSVSTEAMAKPVEVKVLQTGEELKMGSILSYKGKEVGIVIRNENNQVDVWALEEKEGLVWSTETKNIASYVESAESVYNKIRQQENWKEKYPVFAYCAEMDEKTGMEGWYIPEADVSGMFPNRLNVILNKNLSVFNKVLEALGQMQYDDNTNKIYAKYWTCSEGSQDRVNNVFIWQYTPYTFNGEFNKTSTESRNSTFPSIITRCVWSYKY